MKILPLLLVILMGCVPLGLHEKRLSAINAERNVLRKKLNECEGKPKIHAPVQIQIQSRPTIDQAELEQIKKKALEEAEQNYKLRMNRIGK